MWSLDTDTNYSSSVSSKIVTALTTAVTILHNSAVYLAEEGFYKFHNWFDDRAWYPLGRIIGGKRKISHCKVLISHAVFHLRNHLPWFDGGLRVPV